MSPVGIEPNASVSNVAGTLSAFRYGRFDPTTQLSKIDFWRATYTPLGPATVHILSLIHI